MTAVQISTGTRVRPRALAWAESHPVLALLVVGAVVLDVARIAGVFAVIRGGYGLVGVAVVALLVHFVAVSLVVALSSMQSTR